MKILNILKSALIVTVLFLPVSAFPVEFVFNVKDLREREYIEAGPVSIHYLQNSNIYNSIAFASIGKDVITIDIDTPDTDFKSDTRLLETKAFLFDELVKKWKGGYVTKEKQKNAIVKEFMDYMMVVDTMKKAAVEIPGLRKIK